MVPPAPLRFLGAVLGGWVALRVVALVPDWAGEALPDVAAADRPALVSAGSDPRPPPSEARQGLVATSASQGRWSPFGAARAPRTLAFIPADGLATAAPASFVLPRLAEPFLPAPAGLAQLFPPASPRARDRRLAGSAWLFVRDGAAAPGLVPAGELGGSQAGVRLTYRLLGRRAPLALSGRLYMPVDRPEGAEAAVGIDWRPLRGVPLHLLAERREALGGEGRSDFALTVYGGGERRVGPVRVEVWGQAGAVGVEQADLFADGLVRATARVGPLDLGGGVWGGAQPGVSRLDAGPHVSARLPLRGANVRLMGEWRFRLAGDAEPGSGPALTLASDF